MKSHHSVTIQSTEWQAHFSDLSVSLFITPKAARARDVRIKGKYANHSTTGAVINSDEYLVFL